MKKYLVTGLAAVAISGMFTSCTHENDTAGGSSDLGVVETYEKAFISRFGTPSPDADWGFGNGATKAGTRASDLLKEKFTLPEFRDKDDITEPETPTFYTTLEQVKAAGIAYVGGIDYNNGWDNVTAAYLDENSNKIRSDRSQGRTYYISGDVKYWAGFSSGDVTLVVLENSTLHLGCASHNLRIYLAPNAKLDVTKTYTSSEDWSKANESNGYQPEVTITEKDWEGQWTFEKSKALLYLSQGSEVIGGDFKFFDGAKILNEGGTITATNVYVDKNTTLWNEGTVSVSNKLEGDNENAFIYNAAGKTISAASFSFTNNTDLLVNDGTVTITNEIDLHNSGAEIVNNADMSCGSFSQAAGAKMHNVGNMNVEGLTHLDNSNSGWQNEGQWTSGSFEIKGTDKGASNNFNNCRLTVHNEFYLNRGAFILDSGAGVECGSFKIDDTSGFYLGNNSVLKIDGTLTTEIINPEYGFFAYGSEYAAVQANSIETTTNDPESINYYGKLLVAIKPHISEYTAESSVKFTKDNQNIATIPATNCNPGYEGEEPGGGDDDTTPSIRVIAEDMGDQSLNEASDFDFNDVVFDVEYIEEGKVKITILAAGGTLPLTIGWDGTEDPNDPKAYIKHEVHYLLGYSESTMINTHSTVGNYKDGVAPYPFEFTGSFRKDHFAEDVRDNIPVKVRKNGVWYDINAEQGRAPGKIAVGTDYNPWCDERVDIDDWWQDNDKQGLFIKYTQAPETLTKYWYRQAKFRRLQNKELISVSY